MSGSLAFVASHFPPQRISDYYILGSVGHKTHAGGIRSRQRCPEGASEGAKATADHEAAIEATRNKTARLRLQRLAKEAVNKQAEPKAKNALSASKLNPSNDV